MGWEFTAVWSDDPDREWRWSWRRVADDCERLLARSADFGTLDDCIEDAKQHGFDEQDCSTLVSVPG